MQTTDEGTKERSKFSSWEGKRAVFSKVKASTHGFQPEDRVRRRDNKADKLLRLADPRLLDLWLVPGTVTWNQADRQSTIDLVWGSQALSGHLVACELAPEAHADSDHLPIRTLIDIAAPAAEAPKRRNLESHGRGEAKEACGR
jgi:hypothetical protein